MNDDNERDLANTYREDKADGRRSRSDRKQNPKHTFSIEWGAGRFPDRLETQRAGPDREYRALPIEFPPEASFLLCLMRSSRDMSNASDIVEAQQEKRRRLGFQRSR